jgi:hypothetical protein
MTIVLLLFYSILIITNYKLTFRDFKEANLWIPFLFCGGPGGNRPGRSPTYLALETHIFSNTI